jgi:hypothetical protein
MRGRRARVRFLQRRWQIEAFLSRCLSVSAQSIESRRADSNRLPLLQLRVNLSSSTEAEKSLTYKQNYPHSIVVLPSITSGLV